ncbi:MAG: hypothetical protein HFE29_02205 [Clostridia bacterium]|nr:hypothetical protein [Clostridia bacterium]
MKKSLKITFLYIGTAIGAGFSSGKEIALFFGDASPLNVAVSSVFMALLCGLFLIVGKQGLMPKNKLMAFCIFFSAGISVCSMCAGGEFVIRSMTGVPMLGLIMIILGAIIVVMGIEKIKFVNSIVVPLIVLCVALIFFKLDPQNHTLPFTIVKPILYSGLDVLLGGVIISDEGKNMSYKEIILTCLLITVCMFGLLYMLQTVVLADGLASSMPVLAVSERFGLKAICGVLIAGAIFTTLVSALKITSDYVSSAFAATKKLAVLGEQKYKAVIVFGCLLIAYPISFVGFDNIVNTMYPFISRCGIALTAIVTLKLFMKCTRRAIGYAVKARQRRLSDCNRSRRNARDENENGTLPRRDYARTSNREHPRRGCRRNRRAPDDARDCNSNRRRVHPRRSTRPSADKRPPQALRSPLAKAPQRATCGRPPRPSL